MTAKNVGVVVKQLVESFNYGLYYPPANGRAGKFLDEERCMSDYPLSGSVNRIEVYTYHCMRAASKRESLLSSDNSANFYPI